MKTDKFITAPYDLELLNKYSNGFDCGNRFITSFFKDTVSLDFSRSSTYVQLSYDKRDVVGFYSISMSYLEETGNIKNFKIAGAAHIDFFALNGKYHGKRTEDGLKLSDLLLRDCIKRVEMIRKEHIACAFITLASTREGYSLYLRNGFEELDDDISFTISSDEKQCIPMYLPLDYE